LITVASQFYPFVWTFERPLNRRDQGPGGKKSNDDIGNQTLTLIGTPTSPWPVCHDAHHLGWKIDATTAKRVPIAHSETGRPEGTSPRSFGRRRRGNPLRRLRLLFAGRP
jgi:hypothetical protein